MRKKYNLTIEESSMIEKLYFDFIAHRSIVKEIAMSNPTSGISGFAVYDDYITAMKKYDEYVNQLINKYAATEHTSKSNWEINFEECELIIFTPSE